MKFFVDTANIEEIKQANAMGILAGVTTNPSLMAKEKIQGKEKVNEHYKNICKIVEGPVSAEVLSTDFEGMKKEADELVKLGANIVIKVPITADGLKTIKYLSSKNVKTNCTLIFSANQALLAANAGATYVSPFIGRIDDASTDGMQLIRDIKEIFSHTSFGTKILAASARHPMHILESAKTGADVVTAPLSVLQSLLYNPLTQIGLDKFIADSKNLI